MKEQVNSTTHNVSGTFQVVDETRRKQINTIKQTEIDDESLYYARQFMED
jgi:hypothetical protein